MAPLIGLAFLLIAALILLFMRTFTDLLLTLSGLFIAVIWIVGTEGWLGPNGLGLIGPPNSLTVMVPIIMIGLTVDYAIQIVTHYREQRNAGEQVVDSVRMGLRNVAVPLLLAAVTTIVSLLANLFSYRDCWRLRHHRWSWRGDELVCDADVGPGWTDTHRPAAREARDVGGGPAHLKRVARRRAVG